jgi:hypothetical protein
MGRVFGSEAESRCSWRIYPLQNEPMWELLDGHCPVKNAPPPPTTMAWTKVLVPKEKTYRIIIVSLGGVRHLQLDLGRGCLEVALARPSYAAAR